MRKKQISIHSLRMEGDAFCSIIEYREEVFQSTPSAWRETHCVLFWNADRKISIHSLRMEGDLCFSMFFAGFYISIHSLRMEGDLANDVSNLLLRSFQSTPSAWRETLHFYIPSRPEFYFNPLPPHGGRPALRSRNNNGGIFQSTPSAWRETFSQPQLSSTHKPFQSTPSAWRETKVHGVISPDCLHFNPLPPHGGRRHFAVVHANIAINFNPLPPHGGRLATARNTAQHGYFNPLPPHGGRLCRDCHAALHGGISIHSLRMEGDQPHPAPTFRPDISIHSLRMEGDVF